MFAAKRYPILNTILKSFPLKQKNSLKLVVSAILESNSARSSNLASRLAMRLGILFTSALNRLYRLLRNNRVDYFLLTKQMLMLFAKSLGRKMIISIDWTEWHHNLRMLSAAVVAGKRAIPIQTAAFHKSNIPRSQNSRENGFLNTLAMIVSEIGIKPIILCDRGFRRVSWLKILKDRKLDFVIRLQQNVYAYTPARGTHLLSKMGLVPGRALDLRRVELREDREVMVRVIGVWKLGQSEPWWLATSLNCSAEKVVAYYDRRMTIEEQFRDTKGCRFGSKLYWTQFKKPEHLARLALLVGIATLLWTAIGVAATKTNSSLRHVHPKKGPRFSYLTIGMNFREEVMRTTTLTVQKVIELIPKPELRSFPWITFRLEAI